MIKHFTIAVDMEALVVGLAPAPTPAAQTAAVLTRMPHACWTMHPHGRARMACRARRVQNMGWTPSNSLWLATRGGDVYLSPQAGISEKFDNVKLGSRGFGILDVGCARTHARALAVPATCDLAAVCAARHAMWAFSQLVHLASRLFAANK